MALPVSPAGRRYGHKKSPVKPSDLLYRDFHLASPVLPPKVDLSPWLGAVKNQETLGSCTAEAASGLREFLEIKYAKQSVTLSPLFQYYNERVIDGDVSQDNGSTITTAMTALNKYGVCPEADDPFNPANFTVTPSAQAYSDALNYKIGPYHRLMNITDMKNTLNDGYVFEIGFEVYSSFESDQMANTGIMTMPNLKTEQLLGGHAVLVYGYDDTFAFPGTNMKGALLIRNSWGTGWGMNGSGNFAMPYFYLDRFVSDCWMAHPPTVTKESLARVVDGPRTPWG